MLHSCSVLTKAILHPPWWLLQLAVERRPWSALNGPFSPFLHNWALLECSPSRLSNSGIVSMQLSVHRGVPSLEVCDY